MKVILTDPSNPHQYVDIVLYENLEWKEAHKKAYYYNGIPNTRPWYEAKVVSDDYQTVRIPNNV